MFSQLNFPRPVGSLIASVMALAGGVSHRVPGCVFKCIFGCVLETRIGPRRRWVRSSRVGLGVWPLSGVPLDTSQFGRPRQVHPNHAISSEWARVHRTSFGDVGFRGPIRVTSQLPQVVVAAGSVVASGFSDGCF